MNEIQSKITCLIEKLMADYGKGRVIDVELDETWFYMI